MPPFMIAPLLYTNPPPQLPCPKLFELFYCRNGGQCYGRYEEAGFQPAEVRNPYSTYYRQAAPFANGTYNVLHDDVARNIKFTPFCKCAQNYHGPRCEYPFQADLYGFNVSGIEAPEIALITVLVVTLLVLIVIGVVYCKSRKK